MSVYSVYSSMVLLLSILLWNFLVVIPYHRVHTLPSTHPSVYPSINVVSLPLHIHFYIPSETTRECAQTEFVVVVLTTFFAHSFL